MLQFPTNHGNMFEPGPTQSFGQCSTHWERKYPLKLEFTPESVKRQLTVMLLLKREGVLDDREQCYDSILYMQPGDDDIKLKTLAHLVESKKSTLKFSSDELDEILLFLRIIFKEKLDFVPFIKKGLKRIKDSLACMQRKCDREKELRKYQKADNDDDYSDKSNEISEDLQEDIEMYYRVLRSLRDMCICGPDATYRRRQASLEILLLMEKLVDNKFKYIAWEKEQAAALFQLMLIDTYECNKESAFNLIKLLDPRLLQLEQEHYVHHIITVATKLSSSMRPIDSSTAAYMLKVALLSPIIHKRCTNVYKHLIGILLEKLKNTLTLARENIVKTIAKHSIYGYLFCIRSLLQDCDLKNLGEEHLWRDTVGDLVSICFEYSHAVSLIVNNSSPEGHLPMDLDLHTINEICNSLPEKQTVTPQMVLLCSWRTVREVSLLFGLLATEAPICEENSTVGLLNEEQIFGIVEHLAMLLTEAKHRGAFEQAHVGFSQVCTRLWCLNNNRLNQLPKVTLHQILLGIAGIGEENSKLCATRRSAGVPFMIQALVSTEPRQYKDTKTPTFHSVMKILLGFTQLENRNLRDKVKELMYTDSVFSEYENTTETLYHNENNIQVSEIKTHALNILRAIFRHSSLAEIVGDYVADGLIAAIRGYDAPTWAERNASTLLFGALFIRIFGVQRTKDHINLTTENKMKFVVFFKRFPNLLPFVLNELSTFTGTNDNIIKSNVQSTLLLLSRLYQNSSPIPIDTQWKAYSFLILHHVMHCAKSAIYETRKLAARVLPPLLTKQSAGDVLFEIITNVISTKENHLSLNLFHGYMLQIYEIIKHFGFGELESFGIDWSNFIDKTIWILKSLERGDSNPPCFLLARIYVDVCYAIHKADNTYLKGHVMPDMLLSHLVRPRSLKEGVARANYKINIFKFVQYLATETGLIQHFDLYRVYLHSLKDPETQIIAWSAIITLFDKEMESVTLGLLLNYAIDVVFFAIEDFHKYNPELQDAMFNFLYTCLDANQYTLVSRKRQMNICEFVLNEVLLADNKSYYCERDSYLRLLGKSYAMVVDGMNEKEVFDLNSTDEVYNSYCDHLWLASLHGDFRTSVFDIMLRLLQLSNRFEKLRYLEVQCWTTVLQLLLDDNPEVRHEAFLVLYRIRTNCPLENRYEHHLNFFLQEFYECMHSMELRCVALFYWSVSLFDDTDYEMDETDVFNKCTNYDFFEPVELSKLCAEIVAKNMMTYVDNPLSDNTIDWINSRLHTDFPKSISFRVLVQKYETYTPILQDKLRNILDPTYKNKLLKGLAYRQFKEILRGQRFSEADLVSNGV